MAGLISMATCAAAAQGAPPPTMRPIAEPGMGDHHNAYAWSMAWFKGSLYVGTARDPLCVEHATIVHYFPSSGFYRQRPAPDIVCPATIHGADLRAEIWRYAPHERSWTRVYRSPRVANPRAPGRRIARDIGYRGMVVLEEPGRPAALYVAGVTAGEFVPELRRRSPPRILRTTDGARFRAVRGGPSVIHRAAGTKRPMGYRAMAVLGDHLYVTASGGLTGDGVVFRVRDPAGRSPSFEQVTPPDMAVFELETFAGDLYAGTGSSGQGYGVWRLRGSSSADWEPVVTGGAGRGATVTSVVSMERFQGRLYIGANGWGTSAFPASELIRIRADGRWDVVAGAARDAGDGVVREPVSGLGDGFGNPFNMHFWRMREHRGALLLGTNDWSWSLRGVRDLSAEIRAEFGFDLWASCDGSGWWPATRDGFGSATDFGVRTIESTPAGLFLGTTNHVRGFAILRSRRPPCTGRRRAWPAVDAPNHAAGRTTSARRGRNVHAPRRPAR